MNNELLQELLNNINEARELLRLDFKTYIKTIHYYLFKEDFIFKDFHNRITEKLEDFVFNHDNTKHLIINISPRVGKSQLVKYFISWLYSIDKKNNIIYTSYSDSLIRKFSSEIRDLIDCSFYNSLFNLKLKADTTAKNLWQVENGGQFLAGSIKSGITGFGCDYLVIDDPLNSLDYNSNIEKQNVIDIYNNVLKSRFNDKKNGRFILIMQRLAVDDLTGYLLENEKDNWEVISIPAIDEKGNSIFEEKLPIEYLLKEQKINNFTFQAQYMQQPILQGGCVIHINDFKNYELLPKLKKVYITCDTALKAKQDNDYSVFQLWGKTELTSNSDYYLIDMIRGKWEAPDLLDMLLNTLKKWEKYKPTCLYIEDKASGVGLIQQIKRLRIPVKELNPTKDKYQRLSDVLPLIASGYVYLPKIADWKSDFLNECMEFRQDMTHKHDDMVDCLSYALSAEINKYNNMSWIYG